MSARIAAFLVWALVAAVAAFWGLGLLVAPRPVPALTQPVSSAGGLRGDVLRLFAEPAAAPTVGAGPTEPALASRFKLIGLIAPKSAERGAGQGVALIAVDGKPPRAYRVGGRIDQALVLQSVVGRTAAIGPAQGAVAVRLDLPAPALPATGSLPPAEGLVYERNPVLRGTAPAGPPIAPMPALPQAASPAAPQATSPVMPPPASQAPAFQAPTVPSPSSQAPASQAAPDLTR